LTYKLDHLLTNDVFDDACGVDGGLSSLAANVHHLLDPVSKSGFEAMSRFGHIMRR
jgi:hypothetical protein